MEAEAIAAESSIGKASTKDAALAIAINATELYMKALKQAKTESDKARIRSKCKQVLLKAEDIKKLAKWTPDRSDASVLVAPSSERAITKREEVILLESSKVHGFIFPPWRTVPEDAVFEEVGPGGFIAYTDHSDLKLSEAQIENFAGWKRPHENVGLGEDLTLEDLEEELMVNSNPIDLVQDITTDCSLVASLCSVTARAFRGHGKILHSIIYPHDSLNCRPRVSRNGKYIFRLHFNGCFRKVTIDDRLPASNSARRLHVVDRNNPKLLWPALIEKAYLKVRGGYDFPGSNSGTDLGVLTGWIPEQEFLQSDDLQPETLWNRIYKSFGFGDVILTLGTGRLTRKEETALGLAGEHDYAILDMTENNSQRLLLVKNPWCNGMGWKGSYRTINEADQPESSTATAKEAKDRNNGTFWMGFEEVIQHFESLYINWNPGLFRHRQDHHLSWVLPPIVSPGSFAQNPQYAFKSASEGNVWILLSRHFATDEHDIAKRVSTTMAHTSSSLGFISLYIFKANGSRVYLSDNAVHRGAYVDSPQTLARVEVSPSESYTVVAAQHGLPLSKYNFTISFFSRSPLSVALASDHLPHCSIHTGVWTQRTAGGNASSASYPLNPQFSIAVPRPTDLTIILETADEELAVHAKMVWANGERVTTVTSKDIVGGSGDYRRGCALAEIRNVAPGKYTIVCSTFDAGQTAGFTLRVRSAVPCHVLPVLAESAGRRSQHLPILVFAAGVDRMLAPLTVSRLTRLRIVARVGGTRMGNITPSRSRPSILLSVEQGQGPNKSTLDISSQGEFSDAPSGIRTTDLDLSPDMSRRGGLWIVIERTGGRAGMDEVDVEILSDFPVDVGAWGVGDG